MRAEILVAYHDDPISGHLGFDRTYSKLRTRHYWPSMRTDVLRHVRTCIVCQSRKVPRHRPYGDTQFIDVPTRPFEHLQIDLMGPFNRSASGARYIITLICYSTKWIEMKAIPDATAISSLKK